jgi:hypothetical protein
VSTEPARTAHARSLARGRETLGMSVTRVVIEQSPEWVTLAGPAIAGLLGVGVGGVIAKARDRWQVAVDFTLKGYAERRDLYAELLDYLTTLHGFVTSTAKTPVGRRPRVNVAQLLATTARSTSLRARLGVLAPPNVQNAASAADELLAPALVGITRGDSAPATQVAPRIKASMTVVTDAINADAEWMNEYLYRAVYPRWERSWRWVFRRPRPWLISKERGSVQASTPPPPIEQEPPTPI